MEIRIYFRMLQKGWWIVALCVLAALNASLFTDFLATPYYRASAQFMVAPNLSLTANSRDLVSSLDTLDNRSIVATYAEMLGSRRLIQETSAAIEVKAEALEDYDFTTVVLPDANIIELSAEGPDPQTVARLVNAIGQRGTEFINGVYQVYRIEFLDPATVPLEPFKPEPIRNASIAAALGLVLGAALAILSEQLRAPLESLLQRTITDPVSNAYTRRHVQRLLEDELVRHPEGVVSLGLVQLDGLQDLMETLPPVVVQRVMRHVTRQLQNELRGNDRVGRWSETGFAVLLLSTPSIAAGRTLERIRTALEQPVELDRSDETVQLNPRAAVITSHGGQPAAELIRQAESALEKAHEAASDQVVVIDSTRPGA